MTRPRASAWLETSIAAAVTPRCTISASSAWRSVASGVVSWLGATVPATRVSTPPSSPVT